MYLAFFSQLHLNVILPISITETGYVNIFICPDVNMQHHVHQDTVVQIIQIFRKRGLFSEFS
jgi:hypothetical protein